MVNGKGGSTASAPTHRHDDGHSAPWKRFRQAGHDGSKGLSGVQAQRDLVGRNAELYQACKQLGQSEGWAQLHEPEIGLTHVHPQVVATLPQIRTLGSHHRSSKTAHTWGLRHRPAFQ